MPQKLSFWEKAKEIGNSIKTTLAAAGKLVGIKVGTVDTISKELDTKTQPKKDFINQVNPPEKDNNKTPKN